MLQSNAYYTTKGYGIQWLGYMTGLWDGVHAEGIPAYGIVCVTLQKFYQYCCLAGFLLSCNLQALVTKSSAAAKPVVVLILTGCMSGLAEAVDNNRSCNACILSVIPFT